MENPRTSFIISNIGFGLVTYLFILANFLSILIEVGDVSSAFSFTFFDVVSYFLFLIFGFGWVLPLLAIIIGVFGLSKKWYIKLNILTVLLASSMLILILFLLFSGVNWFA